MLGFPSHNKPIEEPFASQIREKLIRYAKGEFTEEEIQQMKHSKEILSQYHAVWKDEKGNIIFES